MLTSEFDFDLPPELIAQSPAIQRDLSRLIVLSRAPAHWEHRHFIDFPTFLHPSDLLVINNSRVINARLRGRNVRTGGSFELLLLNQNASNDWWAMAKPGRRAIPGTQIEITDHNGNVTGIEATVIDTNPDGHRRVTFSNTVDIYCELDRIGEIPLPPYIRRAKPDDEDLERYQTVYANDKGSLAAPTAGLHFTSELLEQVRSKGIATVEVTLHVGLGTFAPVKAMALSDHVMHEERYAISENAAALIEAARHDHRRIVAVGTTTLRVLESVARENGGRIVPGSGRTGIFIYPPSEFFVAGALLTNFHLPRSTLLMLVSAFAAPGQITGRKLILETYAEAIRERYRFFSYGDAMLIC